jgi:hypothetical protein
VARGALQALERHLQHQAEVLAGAHRPHRAEALGGVVTHEGAELLQLAEI